MDKKRQQLQEELNVLFKKQAEIRKALEILDYESNMEKAKEYIGKYYKETGNTEDFVSCLYIYGINNDNCDPIALNISYYGNTNEYYNISHYTHFNPNKWTEDKDKWIQITKEEYASHYQEVQKRINLAFK